MVAKLKTLTKILAVIAAAGMFVVLVMGAAVTDTGSEQGCGKSWPLCHGQLIPQFAVSTAIEFSHRAVVGVESVVIIAVAALSLYLFRSRREIRILAPMMVAFLFLQAALGAWAVMYPQVAAILALHFGVSLVAFASVLLTAVVLLEFDGNESLRDQPIPEAYRRFVWGTAAYTYIVVYLGAYVRHAHADLACRDWPLCNGKVWPGFANGVGPTIVHRTAAGILALVIIGLAVWSFRLRKYRPDLFVASLIALALVIGQSLSGASVVWTRLDLFASLSHAGLVGLMFGTLSYLCLHVLPRSQSMPRLARASHVA